MAVKISIGTDANNAADDIVTVTVRPGDTVVVANNAASAATINYHSRGHGGGVTGTVAASANTSLTAAGTHYLSCAGRADLTISGGIYGP